MPQISQIQRFRERPAGDSQKMTGRVNLADPTSGPSSEATGSIIPENCVAGINVIIAVPKMAANLWLFIKVEISSPIPVAMMIYSSAAGERQETAFMRYAKHKHRQAAEQEKVQHPQRDVWQLFTKQKFTTRGGVT